MKGIDEGPVNELGLLHCVPEGMAVGGSDDQDVVFAEVDDLVDLEMERVAEGTDPALQVSGNLRLTLVDTGFGHARIGVPSGVQCSEIADRPP